MKQVCPACDPSASEFATFSCMDSTCLDPNWQIGESDAMHTGDPLSGEVTPVLKAPILPSIIIHRDPIRATASKVRVDDKPKVKEYLVDKIKAGLTKQLKDKL